jgi:anti-anti-sigma regulatory factor
VRQNDGEVIMVALNELLNSLLVTTKLNSFFIIEPGEEEALSYLKETGIIQ